MATTTVRDRKRAALLEKPAVVPAVAKGDEPAAGDPFGDEAAQSIVERAAALVCENVEDAVKVAVREAASAPLAAAGPAAMGFDEMVERAVDEARDGRDVELHFASRAEAQRAFGMARGVPGNPPAWGYDGRMEVRYGGGDRGGVSFWLDEPAAGGAVMCVRL
jgi:hypothetical protein